MAFWRPVSSRHSAVTPAPLAAIPCLRITVLNRLRAWVRRSVPSRSSVRSTSDEIENPISQPKTTAYSLARALRPVILPSNRRATRIAVSSTASAAPSPTTARIAFIQPPPVAATLYRLPAAHPSPPDVRGGKRLTPRAPRFSMAPPFRRLIAGEDEHRRSRLRFRFPARHARPTHGSKKHENPQPGGLAAAQRPLQPGRRNSGRTARPVHCRPDSGRQGRHDATGNQSPDRAGLAQHHQRP